MICDICNKKKYKKSCDYCHKKQRQEKSPKILCKCGCGELIPSITYDNKPQFYKHGHGNSGSKNNFWSGGIKWDANGYLEILRRSHPFRNKSNYVKLHRIVMERYLGRYLKEDEVVHHINGIKTDNHKNNLIILSRENHASLHHKINMDGRICSRCHRKTRLNKRGREEWYYDTFNNNLICFKCYMNDYHKRKKGGMI